jgi:hypothetical protein
MVSSEFLFSQVEEPDLAVPIALSDLVSKAEVQCEPDYSSCLSNWTGLRKLL